MERHEAIAIGHAIHAYRPDWPAAQITTIIGQHHADSHARAVALALTAAAYDPNARTPAAITTTDGARYWRTEVALRIGLPGSSDQPGHDQPPTTDQMCPTHHAYHRNNCAGCRADQLAATTPRDTEPDPENTPDLNRLNTVLQQATHHLLVTPSQPGSQADTPPTHHHAQQ